MKRPRLLLADDHKIVLEGLRTLLEPECQVVGTVEDGRALVAATLELRPDVVVADISMPSLSGILAAEQIKKVAPETRIIFLTMHMDVTYATQAFEAGASGYVLKHSAPSELVTAIREAMKGGMYVTPMIARDVLQAFLDRPRQRKDARLGLTHRQREILQLVADGCSAKEIASLLDISPRTVEFHKYRMMEDLGLQTTGELIQFAVKHGLTSR